MQPATTTPDRYAELQGLTDDEVHRRYKELGDEAACDYLYNKYRDWIVSTIRARWPKRQDVQNDAEDIFQVAFYETVAKPPFSEKDAFPRALHGTAKSRSIDFARKRSWLVLADDEVDPPQDGPDDGPPTPAFAVSDVDAYLRGDDPLFIAAMEDCMNRLTPQQDSVLLLKFYEGMSPQEIALRLNSNHKAVTMLQVRAWQAIRRCLERKGILRKESR